jgi:multiple sugar transport system ATP-binding protein
MKVVLRDLVKKYPAASAAAVDHVNLSINDGELMVFLGPSGCGKTSTLRMIAGLENPDSGQILIGEREVTHLAPKERRVAMVFQNFSMYPSMTVYENIAFPLQALKLPKSAVDQKVREAAELVGVSALLQRGARQVSGGEAQRVSLARAMVRRPEVFLLDEPLSSLDAQLRVQMRTEVKRLHQTTQTTMIFVTHDQEEAMTIGDRVVVMHQGRVQQVGTPQAVFFEPCNLFVATFVGTPSMNILDGGLQQRWDQLFIDLAGAPQPLPERFRRNIQTQRVTHVKWGIRPEAIQLVEATHPHAVSGQVELSESLGSRQLLFVRSGAHLFSVMVDALHPIRPGEMCHLYFDERRVHLFDTRSGVSLSPPT